MQTIAQPLGDILHKTSDFFKQKGLEKPRLEAELLIAYVLGCKRLELYLNFSQILSADILDRLRPLVKRRANGEPWQYIVGGMDFAKAYLKTDKRALIPRPETEYLYELLFAYYKDKAPPQRIADLGTGTGAIAIALALAFPDAKVWAIDKSPEAISLAKENIQKNGLEQRIVLVPSSWCDKLSGSFDLIVSNPPYLSETEWKQAEPNVRDFEPKSALVAESEGLDCLQHIIVEALPFLAPNGLLALETGLDQHATLTDLAYANAYQKAEPLKDLTKRNRFLWLWKGSQ